MITEHTRLVHWYGSVETKHLVPQIDPEYVRKNASTQLFSALALPFAGCVDPTHSSRSECIGWTRVARRVGTAPATQVTSTSRSETPSSVAGSRASVS